MSIPQNQFHKTGKETTAVPWDKKLAMNAEGGAIA